MTPYWIQIRGRKLEEEKPAVEYAEATTRRSEKIEKFVWQPEFIRNRKTPSEFYDSKSTVGKAFAHPIYRKTKTPNRTPRHASRFEGSVVELRLQLEGYAQCVMKGIWNVVKEIRKNNLWRRCMNSDQNVGRAVIARVHIITKIS